MAAGTDGRLKITLGGEVYTPSPQPAGYIEHVLYPELVKLFSSEEPSVTVGGLDGDTVEGATIGGKEIAVREEGEQVKVADETGNMIGIARVRAYQVLKLFMPDDPKDPDNCLMPEWQFMGFGSQGAYERGEYELEADRGPTIPQIADAISACLLLNGGKVADYLKALVAPEKLTELFSPQVLQGMGDLLVARLAEGSTS